MSVRIRHCVSSDDTCFCFARNRSSRRHRCTNPPAPTGGLNHKSKSETKLRNPLKQNLTRGQREKLPRAIQQAPGWHCLSSGPLRIRLAPPRFAAVALLGDFRHGIKLAVEAADAVPRGALRCSMEAACVGAVCYNDSCRNACPPKHQPHYIRWYSRPQSSPRFMMLVPP